MLYQAKKIIADVSQTINQSIFSIQWNTRQLAEYMEVIMECNMKKLHAKYSRL